MLYTTQQSSRQNIAEEGVSQSHSTGCVTALENYNLRVLWELGEGKQLSEQC